MHNASPQSTNSNESSTGSDATHAPPAPEFRASQPPSRLAAPDSRDCGVCRNATFRFERGRRFLHFDRRLCRELGRGEGN